MNRRIPFRPPLRALPPAAALLLLTGCYTVNSFVDAPDANPGDGVCARAPGAAAPRSDPGSARLVSAETQVLQRAARQLGPDALARITRGEPAPANRAELAAARALALARLRDTPVAGGPTGPIGPGGEGLPDTPLCTLRAAIMEANAQPWKSVITVPAGTYNLTLPHAAGGAGGSLLIINSMRLQGSDAATTIVDGQHAETLVRVDGAGARDVEINHLTLQGANAFVGGGMRIARGAVEMEDTVVRDNYAYSAGGGIAIDRAGELVMRRSTVSENDSAQAGGIVNSGELSIYDSTIDSNTSTRAGGIMNGGNMRLRNVTVSSNAARADSSAAVGGIYQGGYASLNNVTITENQGYGDAAHSFQGGGIQIGAGADTMVRNSIIAGNDGVNGPHDCVGELNKFSQYNLIGDQEGCIITAQQDTYLLDVPAGLGTLFYNGGPTRTHVPQTGSAARDAFPPPTAATFCEPRDQRGVPRPQGGTACDIGAVEYTSTSAAVTGFVLVDTTTNTDIRPLRNDDWLILSQLPAQLSVRATVGGGPASVVFGFAGNPTYRTENTAPFALGGDTAGDYAPTPLAGGQYTLTATPYSAADGGGAAGIARSIRFNVLQVQ